MGCGGSVEVNEETKQIDLQLREEKKRLAKVSWPRMFV